MRSLPPSKPLTGPRTHDIVSRVPPAGARSARRGRCPIQRIADHLVKQIPMWFKNFFVDETPWQDSELTMPGDLTDWLAAVEAAFSEHSLRKRSR